MTVFLALAVAQAILRQRSPWWTHALLVLQSGVVFALLQTKPDADYYAHALHRPEHRGLARPARTAEHRVARGVLRAAVPRPAPRLWRGGRCQLHAGLHRGVPHHRPVRPGLAEGRGGPRARATGSPPSSARRTGAFGHTPARPRRPRPPRSAPRLARELHDAATQTVFSMNLTAEAARMSLAEDPYRVPALLDRLQELARDALAEMRTLVRELRPTTVAETGLVKSLEHHVALRGATGRPAGFARRRRRGAGQRRGAGGAVPRRARGAQQRGQARGGEGSGGRLCASRTTRRRSKSATRGRASTPRRSAGPRASACSRCGSGSRSWAGRSRWQRRRGRASVVVARVPIRREGS